MFRESAAPTKEANAAVSRRATALVVIASAALACKFFYFIYAFAPNVFFNDQWDFLTPFFTGNTRLPDLFLRQQGPPRLGLGLIALKYLYGATHWSTRAESFLVGAAVCAAMILALRLKQKLFGRFAYADAAIPLIFLTLMQYETFIGPVDPSYGGSPLILILVYCLVLLLRNPLLRYALFLPLNFLLIYTGFGFFMGVVTLGVFGLDSYRKVRGIGDVPLWQSIASFALAAASLGSFFIHYTFDPAVACFDPSRGGVISYPWFMALMFSAFLGPRRPVLLVTAGGALGLLIAAATLCAQACRLFAPSKEDSSRAYSTRLIAAVLLAYSFLFAASTAVGRICLGLPDAAQASRYSTLLIPAYLGIYFSLLSLRAANLRRTALALFLAVLIPGGVFFPDAVGHALADGKRAWAACYLRVENIAACDRTTGFALYPYAERNGLGQKLNYLKQRGLGFFHSID